MRKGKAAAIANAKANPDMHPSEEGGKAEPHEDRTKAELNERAKELGIEGRAKMSKGELIDALRS